MTEAIAPKALRVFYGARDKTTAELNTVKSMISPGDREQVIDTPEKIVDGLLKFWGGVALDPCWSPSTIVPSERHYYVPPRIEVYVTNKGEEKSRIAFKAAPGDLDGLELEWEDGTFANPPFKYLSAWLKKAQKEGERGLEVILLGPVRTHRKWWRAAARSAKEHGAVMELDPIKFRGYKQTFPQAMCLFYWGQFPALFADAFGEMGELR